MPLYNVDFPAELELYIKSLRKIAEFDILPTEQFKDWLKENDVFGSTQNKTSDQVVAEQKYASAGFSNFNPIENLFGFILIAIVLLILLSLIGITSFIKKYKDKIRAKLKSLKE